MSRSWQEGIYEMKKQRVLFVSPTPSHPQDAGNRARIFQIASLIKRYGHELHFCHIVHSPGNLHEMINYWDRYINIPPNFTYKSEIIRSWNWRIAQRLPRLTIPYGVDDWIPNDCVKKVKNALGNTQYDIVIVNYVFLSKILDIFDDNVVKIIDTHDKFGGRAKLFLKNNEIPSWFFTTENQERKALNRSDIIFAIQENEYRYFQKLSSKQVLKIGHFSPVSRICECSCSNKDLLFIGSDNAINRHAARRLIDEIFPAVKKSVPNAKLTIAGKVCHSIGDVPEGCCKIGTFGDLYEVYRTKALVVNPVFFGTGLKIKNIEALSFGMAVITTDVGAEGIEEGSDIAFAVASTSKQFSDVVVDLLLNPQSRIKFQKKALEFVKNYNKQIIEKIDSVFSPNIL